MIAHGLLVSLAVMPDLDMHNVGLLGWDNPFYFALTVGGTFCLTTVPDRRGDRAAGKRTLAVAAGPKAAVAVALCMYLAGAALAWRSGYPLLFWLALLAAVLALGSLVFSSPKPVLLAAKLPLLLLTLIAGYFYPPYLVFIVALLSATRIYYRKRFGEVYPRLA